MLLVAGIFSEPLVFLLHENLRSGLVLKHASQLSVLGAGVTDGHCGDACNNEGPQICCQCDSSESKDRIGGCVSVI